MISTAAISRKGFLLFLGEVFEASTPTVGDVGVIGNTSRIGVVDIFGFAVEFLARKGLVSEEDEVDSGNAR